MVVLMLLVALITLIVVPVVIVSVLRLVTGAVGMRRRASPPIPDAVDDRLSRIEEAIDAMAIQIDRIAQQQLLASGRQLPAGRGDPPDESH